MFVVRFEKVFASSVFVYLCLFFVQLFVHVAYLLLERGGLYNMCLS